MTTSNVWMDLRASVVESRRCSLQEATLLERIRGLKEKQRALCSALGRNLEEEEEAAADNGASTDAQAAPRAEVTVQVTSRSLKRPRRNSQNGKARAAIGGALGGAQRDKSSAIRDIGLEAAYDLRERGGFVETRRDELIRKGLLTPFASLAGFERKATAPPPEIAESSSLFSRQSHSALLREVWPEWF